VAQFINAFISDEEWQNLQKNKGADVELHGFLETTKVKDSAEGFAHSDATKKALITITVPSIPESEDVAGFAEIKENSDFGDDDSVLFNIMSKFAVDDGKIEEVGGKQYRSLVLLYGGGAMRKYVQ